MPKNSRVLAQLDLRQWCGLLTLAAEGVMAGSQRAQDLHERIIRPFPVPGLAPITRLIYRSVRAVAGFSGGAAKGIARQSKPAEAMDAPGSNQENVLSILNGICGDHLHHTGNALAIAMQIRRTAPNAKAVALFVHGLCLNDSHWSPELVRAIETLGFSPAFVRYNTGLGVRENGARLAQLIQRQLGNCERVVIIAHSMGGLVVRAALAKTQRTAKSPAWLRALQVVIYLGTPHAGAPLERAGHWLEKLWLLAPYASALAPIAQLRSQGIQDLRQGLATEADAPRDYREYAVAGSLGDDYTDNPLGSALNRCVGDGLVTIVSALGQGIINPSRLPKARQRIVYGIGHMDLLRHPEVAAQLKYWLAEHEI